jgi:hypothetical protein
MKTATHGTSEFALFKYCQQQPIKVEIQNARNTEMLCDPRRFSSLVAGKNGKVINMQMI